jgi:hypothetical protein
MRPMIETELWCLEQLEGRELTCGEIFARSPIEVHPGWEEHGLGLEDPGTGLRGTTLMSEPTIRTALERLRLRGRVARRRELGRDGTGRRLYVYFRVGTPLDPAIATLEASL